MRATVHGEVTSRLRYQTREVKSNPLYQEWRSQIDTALAVPGADSAVILRWVTASYQDMVLQRVRFGERTRSASRIESSATAPLLESLHLRARDEERVMAALLELVITRHVAWPWLGEIAGIGTVLAARLLSRLDIRRAPTPSAFWAYCGLATVPGIVYRCAACDARIAGSARASRMPQHQAADGQLCPSKEGYAEARGDARIAQGRPRAGESRTYDATARAVCYLIGVSFARKGHGYRALMNARYEQLATTHPEWPPKRRYLSAQRVAVKRFLADLWIEWRLAEGLPVVPPFATRASRS